LKETDHNSLTTILAQALGHDRKIIGIGSPRASLESNYALSALTGMGNFYHGVTATDFNLVKTALHILNNGPAHTPSLKEMEQADAVFVIGEDVTNTAPMVALALRQAALNQPSEKVTGIGIPLWHDRARRDVIQDMKSPCFIATPYPTKLDDIAWQTYRAAPDDIAALAFAVAHILDGKAPAPEHSGKETVELAQTITTALKEARHPLIVTGIHSGSMALLQASANVTWALASLGKTVDLTMLLPECNNAGLGMMDGGSLEDAAEVIKNHEDVTVIILENDLFRRAGEQTVNRILNKAGQVIILDHLMNATTRRADVLLPAGTFAEAEGTLVSSEGRAQRFYRVFPFTEPVRESWRWIGEMIKIKDDGEQVPWPDFDSVIRAMTATLPAFAAIKGRFPDAAFRVLNEKIPRQTLRYSGRTAIHAAINVSEPKPPGDPDSPLAFSMEGNSDHTPSSLIAFYWAPGWNSIQAVNKYLEEPAGALKEGNPGVRLIETTPDRHFTYYPAKTSFFQPRQGEWFLVAAHRIFGSEELSSQSPAIAERIPARFVMINSKEASQAGLKDDEEVHLIVDNTTLKLKLKSSPDVAEGIAAVVYNLPGMPWLPLPGWGKIMKISTEK
jgi:NADH-quinone oxidoreductase subunit G